MSDRNGPSPLPGETPEQRQDFDEDANDLWSLYGKEAKSHDGALIETLRGDMDGVLIFVGAMYFSALPGIDAALISGRFILRCSHRVRRPKDSGFESELRRAVGLLPESNSLYAWPNHIATTRLGGRPDLIRLYALPDLSHIGI
jgi:hypothetical protein